MIIIGVSLSEPHIDHDTLCPPTVHGIIGASLSEPHIDHDNGPHTE